MPTVAIESDLYKRVEQAATEHRSSVSEVFAGAVRLYLWELERRKVSKESKVYHQRYAELRDMYLGQYIAMRDGQVVDHDRDFQVLRRRIRQRFGRVPVMITLVKDIAERPLTRHGFRTEMTGQ